MPVKHYQGWMSFAVALYDVWHSPSITLWKCPSGYSELFKCWWYAYINVVSGNPFFDKIHSQVPGTCNTLWYSEPSYLWCQLAPLTLTLTPKLHSFVEFCPLCDLWALVWAGGEWIFMGWYLYSLLAIIEQSYKLDNKCMIKFAIINCEAYLLWVCCP